MKSINSRTSYLIKNTTIFAIGNFAPKIISFILVPLYTNALSTEQYGIIDLISTICSILAQLIVLNIGESIMRFSLDDIDGRPQIFKNGVFVYAVSVIIGLLVFPVTAHIPVISEYAVQIYFFTIFQAGSQILLSYLRGRESLLKYVLGNILYTFFLGIFNVIFVLLLKWGVSGYFIANIYASLVTTIYAIFAGNVIKALKRFSVDFNLLTKMLKYSLPLIPNTFMWWIMNSSDRLMITSMLGATANGIYAVSYKIPSIISLLAGVFNQAWGYSALKENKSADCERYTNSIYHALVGNLMIATTVIMLIIKPFLGIYVSPDYYEAWRYTPFLLIGNVFLSLSTFLSTSYMVNKNSKAYLMSATYGAAANMVLNFILIPIWSIYGAALATCISYIIVFIYRTYDTRKYIKIQVINARYLLSFVVLFLSGATLFLNSIWSTILLVFETISQIILYSDIWIGICRKIFVKLNDRKTGRNYEE